MESARIPGEFRPESPNDLRHTHATLLLDGGASLNTVADRLGHFSAAFTVATYGHSAGGRPDLLTLASP